MVLSIAQWKLSRETSWRFVLIFVNLPVLAQASNRESVANGSRCVPAQVPCTSIFSEVAQSTDKQVSMLVTVTAPFPTGRANGREDSTPAAVDNAPLMSTKRSQPFTNGFEKSQDCHVVDVAADKCGRGPTSPPPTLVSQFRYTSTSNQFTASKRW